MSRLFAPRAGKHEPFPQEEFHAPKKNAYPAAGKKVTAGLSVSVPGVPALNYQIPRSLGKILFIAKLNLNQNHKNCRIEKKQRYKPGNNGFPHCLNTT